MGAYHRHGWNSEDYFYGTGGGKAGAGETIMSYTNADLQQMLRGNDQIGIDVDATATQKTKTVVVHELMTMSSLESHFIAQLERRMPQCHGIIAAVQHEYQFHDTRKWRLDFAWPAVFGVETLVAVEVHGLGDGQGGNGRHTRPSGFTEDRRKMNAAAVRGWIVLEATRPQIDDNTIFADLLAVFESRGVAAR